MNLRLARRTVLWLKIACAAPPLIVGALAWRYMAGYALLDNQRFAWMAESVLRGKAPLSTLFDPVNAHRQPVIILMLDMLGRLSHWDFRWFSVASYLFAIGSYFILLEAIRRTIAGRVTRWACAAVGSLLVFSTVRASVWQMSWGAIWPFMDAFVFAALCIAASGNRWRSKNAAGALLCIVGMWVLLQGLLLWFVVPACLAAARVREGKRLGRTWVAAWLGGAAIAWAAYFNFGAGHFKTWGDADASMPSLFSDVAGNLVAFLKYFFGVAGMFSAAAPPTAGGLSASALWPGALAVAMLAGLAWATVRSGRSSLVAAPWLALAAFGFLSACLIAVGRFRIQDLAFGFEAEGSDHYAFSSLLLVMGLWFALAQSKRWVHLPSGVNSRLLAAGLATGLLLFAVQGFIAGIEKFPRNQTGILSDKARFYFCRLTGEYDNNQHFRDIPAHLSDIGFYRPLLFTKDSLAAELRRADGETACGAVEKAWVVQPDGSVGIEGWSWMPPGRRWPDEVFLVADSPSPRVLGYSGSSSHSDAAVLYRSQTGRKAGGWSISLKAADLPAGTSVLHAYVLDADSRAAYRVGGSVQLVAGQEGMPEVRLLER